MSNFAQLIEAHWQQPRRWLSAVLFPLSRLFALIATSRAWLYRKGIFKSEQLAVPVIVIGNLHAGGSGKTPVTAAIAQALGERGLQVGIISRGYGRSSSETLLVNTAGTATEYGDEPLLLARTTGVPVVVGADRVAAGRLLLEKFPATQIILSDDGLQHYRLARTMEIVVFPAADLTRKNDVLPNGALREPLSRLQHADAVLLSNDDAHAILPAWFPQNLPVYRSHLDYADFYALNQPEQTVPASFFTDKKVAALAAIGRPQRFFNALQHMGLTLSATIILPDHAPLRPAQIPQEVDAVIVTEKDAVKLAAFALPQVWVLPVCAIIPPDLVSEICHHVR